MGAGGMGAGADGSSTQGLGSDQGFGGGSGKLSVGNQSYYFDFNQDNVHQDDAASINAQAKYVVAHPSAAVRLEGIPIIVVAANIIWLWVGDGLMQSLHC